jgi:hypothetical protein
MLKLTKKSRESQMNTTSRDYIIDVKMFFFHSLLLNIFLSFFSYDKRKMIQILVE